MFCSGLLLKHDIPHNTSPAEQILASSEPVWSIFSNTIVNCVTKIGSWIYIVSRTMLIMINGDNKKIGKAWKCENIKDSFRFTWCNCWFKDGCSFWIWIGSFILSWKPVGRDPKHGSYPLNTRHMVARQRFQRFVH